MPNAYPDSKRTEARRLHAKGTMGYQEIADVLGVGVGTIHRWVNPESEERGRKTSLAWKERNREKNRARDREYYHRKRNSR